MQLSNTNLHNNMMQNIKNKSFLSLEITPSKGGNINKILSQIEELQIDTLVDAFITTDNPLAKMKYSATLSAIKIQQTFNKPTIATMSMRDRNIIGLQSDLLGANDFDITSFLTLTGDSPKHGDNPSAKSVLEGSSQLLLQIIQSLNAQKDYSGNKLTTPIKEIYPFSTMHSYSPNLNHIKKRMQKKLNEYAVAIITQPIYDTEHAKILIDMFEDVKNGFNDERKNAQLIFGMFPVTKYKTAKFLHEKVVGLHIPNSWLEKLEIASKISTKEEYDVGFKLSYEIFKNTYSLNPRAHLMSANDFKVAYKILSLIKK